MVNILETRPYLTLKGLTHVLELLSRKSSKVVVDKYPLKFVAAALIGAEIDGEHYMPPSRRCDSQTPLQCAC